MINPVWLALIYGTSEMVISTFMRSKGKPRDTDGGSLRLLWRVIGISMASAIFASFYFRAAFFGGSAVLYWSGALVFAFALALRWYSIAYLGRFFTVDVAVAADQHVIDSGPYRFIRHPSYTGNLLAFLGLGLCFANAITMLLMVVPTTAVFLYRIRLEEAALQVGLGEPYKQYMQRTKRLIPFVY